MTIPRMSGHRDNPPSVRRVVLSSGRMIEVVHWERSPGASEPTGGSGDLHVCRWCGSSLVHPTSWHEVDERHWRLTLRCPDCERAADGVFGRSAVERFDDELSRGGLALTRDLRKLAHANMEEECERFIAALHAGHVLPVDF
jgi:ribosomal protein S27E